MSFSNNVKSELISAVTDYDKKYACLYGMLLFCKRFSSDEICFQSENTDVAGAFYNYMTDLFIGSVKIKKEESERKNGTVLYSIIIDDTESVKKITETFKIDPKYREIDLKNIDNNSISCFVAGVFLCCGSVTNPEAEYHLEFVISGRQLYSDLSAIMRSFGFSDKMVMRKNSWILYFKESENIEDLLTFMGAQNSTLELINVKIFKDVRNRVNRVSNCDLANCSKTIEAGIRQKQDIELIDQKLGLDSLPGTLQEIALLRIENPEMSLKELGEMFDPPLGRSGVNHRLKRLAQIADGLRGNN